MIQAEAIKQARLAEQDGRWENAVSYWKAAASSYQEASYLKEAETCQYIADAIARGDQYRDKVLKVAGVEPDRNSAEWKVWFGKMEEVYNQMYRS